MVKAKKYLGQHFLKDKSIAQKIVELLQAKNYDQVVEVGPGTGVLTDFLFLKDTFSTTCIDLDLESIEFLRKKYPEHQHNIIHADFLAYDLSKKFQGPVGIIGNFPYNISAPIFFKILENKDQIPEVTGMVQKEVGQRICAQPGNKQNGILSILLQTFYEAEYCFTVPPHVFHPPPKVDSAVIRLVRNQRSKLEIDEKFYIKIVKQAFSQRRKMLRNTLKTFDLPASVQHFMEKRAEQLSVEDFIFLAGKLI